MPYLTFTNSIQAAKQLKQKAAEALQEQQAAQQQAAQQAAQQQAAQQQAAQQQAAQQQAQQQQLQQQQLQQQQQQQQLQQQIQIQQPQFSIQNGPPPPGTVQVVQNGQPMMVQNIVQVLATSSYSDHNKTFYFYVPVLLYI